MSRHTQFIFISGNDACRKRKIAQEIKENLERQTEFSCGILNEAEFAEFCAQRSNRTWEKLCTTNGLRTELHAEEAFLDYISTINPRFDFFIFSDPFSSKEAKQLRRRNLRILDLRVVGVTVPPENSSEDFKFLDETYQEDTFDYLIFDCGEAKDNTLDISLFLEFAEMNMFSAMVQV